MSGKNTQNNAILSVPNFVSKGVMMTRFLKDILRKPYRKLQQIFGQLDFVPSGHFYSPIANNFEIKEGIAHTSYDPDSLQGIDLNLAEQRKLLEVFGKFTHKCLFQRQNSLICAIILITTPIATAMESVCIR